MKKSKPTPLFVMLVIVLLFQSAWTTPARTTESSPMSQDEVIDGPFVGEKVTPASSAEVRSLPLASDEGRAVEAPPRRNPLQGEADQGARGTWNRQNVPLDPLIQAVDKSLGSRASPPVLLSFDGNSNPAACGGCSPPDTTGDVGPSHYIQMVNVTKVAIYNKSGVLLAGPFNLSTFWSSGNCAADAGDPVVLYDPIAKRWLLSQFASPTHMCVAISKTSDPTGSYWIYEFNVGSFPDYFKFGVWPDAYYMSANEATYTAYAFDRAKMLTGAAATFQKFTGGTNLYLPSDLDGARVPPSGTPNYFYTFKDSGFHGGASDRIELRAFHVDWVTPANSTFTLQNSFTIPAFTYTVCGFFNLSCIRQLGTAQRFDSVSEWPMFRFPYRNFGARQSLVGTFTVGGGASETGSAIRWFELRNTGSGWTLFQQGTFDPADNHDRVMPSIAMDSLGNIALGYTVSSSAMNPAIRYTVHRAKDAAGTMQAEGTLINGGGSQTGSNRWGDYSTMSVDPSDDISFWYTNEYYSANSPSNWKTRIGKFKVASIASLRSIAANDGWVLESTETSNIGGSANATATTFRLGDDAADRQYRGILHFDTSTLPDTAVILKVVVKITKQGLVGEDPFTFTATNKIAVDIMKGLFSGNAALQAADFQAAASASSVGTFSNNPVGSVYTATLNATGLAQVNKTGVTQLRLRFQTDDNDNTSADYLAFFSGNEVTTTSRPLLQVYYYVP